MAFIKLLVPEKRGALSVKAIVRRLRDEFAIVDANEDEGRDHVAGMIAATLRFSDSLPHKQAQLDALMAAQEGAIYVSFGDTIEIMAACCLLPGHDLFFDNRDEIDGSARPLVDRCAAAIGYDVYDPDAIGRRGNA